jgi:hypothetical protein
MGGHVARMGEKRNAYRILVRKPEGKRPLRRPRRRRVDILKWILEKQDVMLWIGLIWLRIGTNGGPEWLHNWRLFKKGLAPWVSAFLSCISWELHVPPISLFSIYLSIYLSIYGSTAFVKLGRFFSSLSYTQSVGTLGRGISSSLGRYLQTEKNNQNKNTQTSMPRMGFEPTIPVFERRRRFMP